MPHNSVHCRASHSFDSRSWTVLEGAGELGFHAERTAYEDQEPAWATALMAALTAMLETVSLLISTNVAMTHPSLNPKLINWI